MHHKTISENHKNNCVGADQSEQLPSQSAERIESSRMAVLYGWLISMIGIVFYCFVMLDSDSSIDPYSTVLERGLLGWAAILFILVGVGLWLMGTVNYLKESEQSPEYDNGDNSTADRDQ